MPYMKLIIKYLKILDLILINNWRRYISEGDLLHYYRSKDPEAEYQETSQGVRSEGKYIHHYVGQEIKIGKLCNNLISKISRV